MVDYVQFGVFATDTVRMSEWLKDHYVDTRYIYEVRSVNVVEGMRTGAVIDADGDLVLVATVASAIVADETVVNLAPGTYDLVCLVNGYALVAPEGMQFGADVDTPAKRKTALAPLAAKNILTVDYV
jgi:hypothetical protein